MRPFFLVLCLILTPLTLRAAALDEVTLPDGRTYLGAAPPGAAHPPLIVALHGGGGNGAQFARQTGLAQAALSAGFAVVFPEGSSRRGRGPQVWNALYCCGYAAAAGVDDVAFLDRVIADAAHRYGVDPARVYVTGMSNGAMMAETYGALRPKMVRAVAAVSGTMDVRQVRPKGAVALLHIHGTADENVPYDGGRGGASRTQTEFSSVSADMKVWRAAQGRALTESADVIDRADDGMKVERARWSAGGQVRVELLTVVGGGHNWPGGRRSGKAGETADIDATREVIAFFRSVR